MIRTLVVDDHAAVREGFAALLAAQPDIEVIGQAGDGRQAEDLARRLKPDVILMDIRMPHRDGLSATRDILRDAPGTRVVVMTTFDLDAYILDALRAGASGFLLKDSTASQLVDAVRVVAGGDSLLTPSVTRRVVAELVARLPAAGSGSRTVLDELTEREVEVVRLVARGLSNQEISRILCISVYTVKSHISRTFTKLGLRDRAQAVVLAYETGLVVPGSDG